MGEEYTDVCPVCGSGEWEADHCSSEVWEEVLTNQCRCFDCGSTWEEKWSFIKLDNIVDER